MQTKDSKTVSLNPDRLTEMLWVLGVVLVSLKAAECTKWPWWAVTMPFWAPIALGTLVFVLGLVLVAFGTWLSNFQEDEDADDDIQE